MIVAAVAKCFSALKSSLKNLPIVIPINREISLFCGPSTWKLWIQCFSLPFTVPTLMLHIRERSSCAFLP